MLVSGRVVSQKGNPFRKRCFPTCHVFFSQGIKANLMAGVWWTLDELPYVEAFIRQIFQKSSNWWLNQAI